jgi:tRNA dimethylallyltransferase
MSSLPRVLVIVGPTASGKTPLALLVAERLTGEVISADSRQVYRYLTIGTAKPSSLDLKRICHHCVDILDPSEEYNAGLFGEDATIIIRDIVHRNHTPILVGGSGLYLKAVIDGLFSGPGKDAETRFQLEERLKNEGAESLLEVLQHVDPVSGEKMSPTKPRRIIRALEVYYATGKPISEFHAEQERKPEFNFIQMGLAWERKELYERIDTRVGLMIEQGLVREVEELQKKGFAKTLNALNTVGYKEIFDYLEGRMSLQEAGSLIKRNTRRFAKRQLTWFRADKRIHWLSVNGQTDFKKLAEKIVRLFES